MKLVDSNVWLALAIPRHAHHTVANDWFYGHNGNGELLFCRATQQTFLRLLTTRAVLNAYGSPPLTCEQARTLYEAFQTDHRVGFLEEPTGLEGSWKSLSSKSSASPKLWMDAYLAAFSIASGHPLATIDRDFKQFLNLDIQMLGAEETVPPSEPA